MVNTLQNADAIEIRFSHLTTTDINHLAKACLHFKHGDKNEINCRQTRKIA